MMETFSLKLGAEGVSFDGYDGQPVIIWNDCRAGELIKTLGGRGNVFNVFDTHPSKGKQNIKYGSVNLVNRVNIVNSVQSYTEFLDGLAGEYTDRDGKQIVAEDKTRVTDDFLSSSHCMKKISICLSIKVSSMVRGSLLNGKNITTSEAI